MKTIDKRERINHPKTPVATLKINLNENGLMKSQSAL